MEKMKKIFQFYYLLIKKAAFGTKNVHSAFILSREKFIANACVLPLLQIILNSGGLLGYFFCLAATFVGILFFK